MSLLLGPTFKFLQHVVPVFVVEDEVKAVRIEDLGFVAGTYGVEESVDTFFRSEHIVWSVEHQERGVDRGSGVVTGVDKLFDFPKKPQGERLHVVGRFFHLRLVRRRTRNILITNIPAAETFERDAHSWSHSHEYPNEGHFPRWRHCADRGDGRCEHESGYGWCFVRSVSRCFGQGVQSDECAHALTIPKHRDVGMAFFYLTGEGEDVVNPLLRGADIALALEIRIVALAAKLHCVYEGVSVVAEVLSERPEVAGGTTQAVGADNDALWSPRNVVVGCRPAGVGHRFAIRGFPRQSIRRRSREPGCVVRRHDGRALAHDQAKEDEQRPAPSAEWNDHASSRSAAVACAFPKASVSTV